MPKPIQAAESFQDLQFPLHGINVSTEIERMPPGTTPIGQNVRTFEPTTMRGRGGARPGLVKYLDQLPNGHQKIQHLNYIVDPTVDALIMNDQTTLDPDVGGPWVIDPSTNNRRRRNPGRYVRPGGGGGGLVRGRPKRKATTDIAFVQSKSASYYNPIVDPNPPGWQAASDLVFDDPVTAGDFIVVGLVGFWGGSDAAKYTGVNITDSQGNTYTKIKFLGSDVPGAGNSNIIAYTFARVDGALTVTATPQGTSAPDAGQPSGLSWAIGEYSSVKRTGTVINASGIKTNAVSTTYAETEDLTVGSNNGALIGFVYSNTTVGQTQAFTSDAGTNDRDGSYVSIVIGGNPSGSISIFFVDQLRLPVGSSTASGSYTNQPSTNKYFSAITVRKA